MLDKTHAKIMMKTVKVITNFLILWQSENFWEISQTDGRYGFGVLSNYDEEELDQEEDVEDNCGGEGCGHHFKLGSFFI